MEPKETEPLERLTNALKLYVEEQTRPRPWYERYATPAAVVASALGIVATIIFSYGQLSNSSKQFDRTVRENQYSDIVTGLDSSSVAVQVNSTRRLTQYVLDEDNFDDGEKQAAAVQNAAQTLAAFIVDESRTPKHEGLSDYRDPQPVVVSRAVDQLKSLLNEDFPEVVVDLSRGNFHGVNLADVKPVNSFLAVGADFRVATLTGWDLSAVDEPALNSAFFTCADLQTSDLGAANVDAADFTGANLRGADLSEVSNLTEEQLRGALVGDETDLPAGVEKPLPENGWGYEKVGERYRPSPACLFLVDRMTDVLAGGEFSRRLPCTGSYPWAIRLAPAEDQALHRVCDMRSSLPSMR